MVEPIDRTTLQRRLQEVQLIEVLPREEFEWAHLPGAVHLPLKQFDPSKLSPSRPVVAYCNDFL